MRGSSVLAGARSSLLLALLVVLLAARASLTQSAEEEAETSTASWPSSAEPPLMEAAPSPAPAPDAAPPLNTTTSTAVQRGLQYLVAHRQPDWGWGNYTPRVILAIQFANMSAKEVEQQSLEMQLSVKQMEIDILNMMSRQHEALPVARLADYTLAEGALCRDPRALHGRDLVAALLHREPPLDLDLARATLAACSAAAHVRRRHIRRLLDIANAPAEHNLDLVSMVILALRCIVQDHRHRDLLHFVRRPLAGLARHQLPDGGFGAVSTTALAIQALENADAGGGQQNWNGSAARLWLTRQQHADGGWGGVRDTAAAVAALSAGSLVCVRPPHCRDKLADTRHDATEPDAAKLPLASGAAQPRTDLRNVSFTYTLWIGTNVSENYTLYMSAPRNISFYRVMQLAAELDPKFRFSASAWPNGHYVHTLADRREEPMAYHYWLLYRLTETPDPASPPANQLVAPVGVDDLLVEEGEHYLFWYKKL